MTKYGTTMLAVVLLGVVGTAIGGRAVAETRWERRHPRRTQVNGRLENQNRRINKEEREGEMTPAQARALHAQDRRIRQEERAMASQHGGHITKQEQSALNQQENAVSREIGR